MNEKNKLTNGSQSNQSENNYSNSNSLNYNNSENNSSNQYYFEEENYNNNRNFENYNYNNQEQYYNNNYDSNYPNNSNYNGNNSQNPYYNNSYNQNIDENNNQFLYDNQGQYPNYDNNFDENNEQIFYNNQEQFPNYNNDFNGNSEQVFYNNQEQYPNYNNDFNGNSEQVFYNNQEQFPHYNNDFNGNSEQNFYNNQEQFPNYNNAFNGNNEQGFYNNQEQYSNVVQNGSVSYQNTNPILTDVPQEETHTSSNNNFESVNTQQETQNTQDILMARELQKDQKFDENQEHHDSQDPSDGDKIRKSKLGIIIASIIGLIVLLSVGGYFAYNHIYKNKEIAVNMSQYELEFTANGTEGEGKPSANIKNIPNVDNASDELKQLLQNPKISYDKNDNLRNGDKVEVSLSLDKSEINGKKIVIKDEFKRSFTVKGLKEKDKETTKTKENNNNDSNSNSSDKSTSKTNSRVKEDSSVDTTKLSEEQVKNWVLASYIQHLPDMTKDDYIVNVDLHSDNLVYAVISENPNSSKHPSPKMLPTRYRINAKGELEASSRMTEDWRVISKVYMYVE